MANEKKEERLITFLPEDSGKVDAPDRRGQWCHIDDLMAKLADGIEVPEDASPGALTAIPTVWARPILFAQALADRRHPLHKDVVREWRGLLGLFCFKSIYKWNLHSKPYRIEKGSAEPFERALYTLKPNDDWLKGHLIYIDGILIGGTSPHTLFYTRPEYECPASVDWQSNGRLDDPAQHIKPGSVELHVLKKWAEKARNDLTRFAFRDAGTQTALLRAFNEWIDGIDSRRGRWQVKFGPPVVHDPPYQFASFDSRYTPPPRGDFFLRCRQEKPPIIVLEDLWKRGGMVYEPLQAAKIDFQAIPDKLEGDAVEIGKSIQYEGKYLRPEHLFTDKIFRVDLFADNVLLSNKKFALPLRKKILEFFEPEDLLDLVSLEEQSEGVQATLRLPLDTESGLERFVPVSRFYPTAKIIIGEPPPYSDVWPNFRAKDWTEYYSKYEHKKTLSESSPEPVGETKHGDTSLHRMKAFPEAIVCTDSQGNPIGLVPIKRPGELPEAAGRWIVSVDFGTSNTTVFFKGGADAAPSPFAFKDRCFQVTYPDDPSRRETLFSSFFPPREINGIFPSHLRVFGYSPSPQPIIHGLILFVGPAKWSKIMQEAGIRDNLKWSKDKGERSHIITLLKQTLLMITAEARVSRVNTLEIRYSYPSSYTSTMKDDLKSFWDVTRKMGELSGFHIDVRDPETESACICKYLVNVKTAMPKSPDRPQIVIDTGGGTTDLAVWLDNCLQVQTSLLLAGNQVSIFAGNEKEFRDRVVKLLKDKAEIDEELFREHPSAVMNVLLQLHGAKITEAIRTTEKHTPEFKRARTIVFLTAAGVFYYAGLLIRYLASMGKNIRATDVYLAGNGSRLLEWVGDRDYGPLREILESGVGPTLSLEDIRIHEAAHPKTEVANGLLRDYTTGQSVRKPVVILGESGYKSGGDELSWDFDMPSNVDALRAMELPETFPELKRFVEAFNSQAKKLALEKIGFEPSLVAGRVQQSIAEYEKEEDDILFKPLFIEEVKAVLADLCGGEA